MISTKSVRRRRAFLMYKKKQYSLAKSVTEVKRRMRFSFKSSVCVLGGVFFLFSSFFTFLVKW